MNYHNEIEHIIMLQLKKDNSQEKTYNKILIKLDLLIDTYFAEVGFLKSKIKELQKQIDEKEEKEKCLNY